MISGLLVILSVLGPAALMLKIAPQQSRVHLAILLTIVGSLFLVALSLINDAIAFTTGGDDLAYFKASERQFASIADWFDLGQFSRTHEQGGYPLLLSWVHQVSGGSIFHRKVLNVGFFLLLVVVWCDIGNTIGGRRLAVTYTYGTLFTTPLWFYWMFLLKDMVIVLLQSLFILGVVSFITTQKRVKGYVLSAVSTLVTIPFRSLLTLVNILVLALASTRRLGVQFKTRRLVGQVVIAASIVIGVLIVGTQPELLGKFGVIGGDRALDLVNIERTVAFRERARMDYFYNPVKFGLVYLVGEMAAFNPESWSGDGVQLLRAVSMAPWIYIGLPLFLRGLWLVFRPATRASTTKGTVAPRLEAIPLERAYVFVFLSFIAIYAVMGWLIGDTTRWRMPSFPPMVAIAGLAWVGTRGHKRTAMLLIWAAALTVAVVVYYTAFK